MDSAERHERIESFGRAHALLVNALTQFPREMWQYRPSGTRWSIHEIIVHLTDSEANAYIRCRRVIAEPGCSVMAYDQDAWARSLLYHNQSTDEALDLFRLLHSMNYKLIRSLPELTWTNAVNHPEHGLMNLDRWLDLNERHVPSHIQQMKRNYASWRQIEKAS